MNVKGESCTITPNTPGCGNDNKLLGWQSIEIGAMVTEPGNSRVYETGTWRAEQPVWNSDTCIDCMLCWVGCPDTAIKVKDGHMAGINYFACKGCGICVEQCPTKPNSLSMIPEDAARGLEVPERVKIAFNKE